MEKNHSSNIMGNCVKSVFTFGEKTVPFPSWLGPIGLHSAGLFRQICLHLYNTSVLLIKYYNYLQMILNLFFLIFFCLIFKFISYCYELIFFLVNRDDMRQTIGEGYNLITIWNSILWILKLKEYFSINYGYVWFNYRMYIRL